MGAVSVQTDVVIFAAAKKLARKVNNIDCKKSLQRIFPFLSWIQQYSVRKDLPLDIISGCTVAIMHIPQGELFEKEIVLIIILTLT